MSGGVDKLIQRNSRSAKLGDDGIGAAPAEKTEDRIAELDATIFKCWARRREQSVVAGRALIELKKLVGHGKWERHVEEKFDFDLRTAERWMKRARKADAETKSDNLTTFSPATDREATQIKSATEEAEAKVDAELRKNSSLRKTHVYRLPLRLTADEAKTTDAIRRSAEWPQAEKRIVRLLRQLLVKYEAAGSNKRERL
jgi:hypothetical protein